MTTLVTSQLDRGVARVTLDSPHNRNALSSALVEQLSAAIEAAKNTDGIRALVVTGAGSVFCAGADLKEPADTFVSRAQKLTEVLDQLRTFPQPVIVELNGDVRAGGLGILGAADIVVAPNSTTFAFTEVRIGVVPAIIAVLLMPRMGARAVNRYFLTGETFDAHEAERNGLITLAVPKHQVHGVVDAMLDGLRKASPDAVAGTKDLLLQRQLKPADAASLSEMAQLSAKWFGSPGAREGMLAFREKRKPKWSE